jgi:hypothetical protein
MKPDISRERAWMAAALALSTLALVLTAVALARLPGQAARFRQKQGQLERLRGLAESGARPRAARQAFETLERPEPVPLDGLIRAFAGGAAPDIRDSGQDNLDAGWIRRRVAVSFSDIGLEDLWMVLRQAESQRPPWRLASLEVLASATLAGRGRATLTFEVLARPAE